MIIRRSHFASDTEARPADGVGAGVLRDAGAARFGFSLRDIRRRRLMLEALKTYTMEGAPHAWNLPPDFHVVGRGYDIYGHYAFSGSCKGQIFDWRYATDATKFGRHEVPACVAATAQNITDVKVHTGESALEIQSSVSRSMSVSAGLLGLFSGTVKAGIAEAELRKSRRSYAIVQLFCGFNRYAFDPMTAAVRKLMTPEFRLALDRYEPEELFKAYGTHFPVEVVTGGRLDYCCSTRVFEYKSNEAIATSAKASLDVAIGSIGLGGSSDVSKMVASFENATDENLLSYGGAPQKAALIGGSGGQADLKARYLAWLESVPDDLAFVDFGAPDCLRGLWTLCDDVARRGELEQAATEYLKKRDAQNRIEADRIVDVVVVAGNHPGIAAPAGYEKLAYDLNKGAGGDFVYACIRKEPVNVIKFGNVRPVVDLAVVWGGSAGIAPPEGFEKVPVDLNRGAGGRFIYLCKRHGQPGVPDGGLRDLTIVGGGHADIAPPYGYRRVDADLNKGAGGEFIYFCMI